MYREASHTADEAYEIVFSDTGELFSDLVDIIKDKVVGSPGNATRMEEYELSGDLMDDVFDVANDMIYMVDRGWVPEKSIMDVKRVKIVYREFDVEKFDFKAMTYHMNLKEHDDKKILKVVFDI